MKKGLFCLALLILFSVFSGCLDNADLSSIEESSQNVTTGYDSYIEQLRYAILHKDIGIPKDEDKEKMANSAITVESIIDHAAPDGKNEKYILFNIDFPPAWIIAFNTESGPVFQYVLCAFREQVPKTYFSDIDGDGLDEIILNSITPANGVEFYETRIFKRENDTLQSLYFSSDYANPEKLIDTGFEVIFSKGYNGVMKNIYTNTETAFAASVYGYDDISNYIEVNKAYKSARGTENNFFMFKPIDIENDGVSEIVAGEAFFISVQGAWRIGDTYAVLKYDVKSSKFQIVKSAFFPYGTDMDQELFENNWYKN